MFWLLLCGCMNRLDHSPKAIGLPDLPCLRDSFKNVGLGFFLLLFVSSGLDCLRRTVAAHCAPMDTHDIATKPSPQLMVLRHGALSGFCPIIILMKRLNAFVVGWRVGVGAVWLGGP